MEKALLNEILVYAGMLSFSFVTIFIFWRLKGRKDPFIRYLVLYGYRIGTLTFLTLLTLYCFFFQPLI